MEIVKCLNVTPTSEEEQQKTKTRVTASSQSYALSARDCGSKS